MTAAASKADADNPPPTGTVTMRPKRVLSKKETKALTSLSPQQMYRLSKEGRFPQLVKLGDYPNSRAGYIEAEVLDWIDERVRLRDARSGPAQRLDIDA